MIVGILLAAGGSSRFGSQKLIARYYDAPLVRSAADLLRQETDWVIAIVGSNAQAVREALDGSGIEGIIENPDWRDGLSTSLRRGVASVPPETEAVVVALGDQPRIEPDIIRAVIDRWRETGMPIVTARYRGVSAPPVLLAREVFADVEQLRGDVGAKQLIAHAPDRVAYVDLDYAMPRDVDTPADLAALDDDLSL